VSGQSPLASLVDDDTSSFFFWDAKGTICGHYWSINSTH